MQHSWQVVARLILALSLGGRVWWTAPSTAAAEPPTLDAPAPDSTGQKISLDLKGVDIIDVLKLLSQKSGINFVAGHTSPARSPSSPRT